MKYIKMLGLAALAAMALTAFVGAGTASASELCSTNTSPCTGTMYTPGTKLSATSTKAVLTTSGGLFNPTVTCTESATAGEVKTTGAKGSVVEGTINSLSFGKCTNSVNGKTCTVTSVNTPYLATGTATGGGNGTLKVESDGKGNPGAKVECPELPTCTYGAASVTLDVDGGAPALATAVNEALSGGSFPCPPNSQWTAIYTLSPSPLFLVNP